MQRTDAWNMSSHKDAPNQEWSESRDAVQSSFTRCEKQGTRAMSPFADHNIASRLDVIPLLVFLLS